MDIWSMTMSLNWALVVEEKLNLNWKKLQPTSLWWDEYQIPSAWQSHKDSPIKRAYQDEFNDYPQFKCEFVSFYGLT